MINHTSAFEPRLVGPHSGLRNYSRVSIGDRLERDFGNYVTMPITQKIAASQGWYPMGTCKPGLGVPYAQVTTSQCDLRVAHGVLH